MPDLNQITDQILEFSDEETLLLFSKVADRMSLIFDAENLPLIEVSIDVQIAVDDVLDFSNDDAKTILRIVGLQKGLPFPKSPPVKDKILNGVTITLYGDCYHRGNCECLSWVSNETKLLIERERAVSMGHTPCGYCRPDLAQKPKIQTTRF